MALRLCFPTTIYSAALQSSRAKTAKQNRELFKQILLIRDTDDVGRAWSEENYHAGYTSYGSWTELHRHFPHFVELREQIDGHVRKFARALDMDLQSGHLAMVSCWVNLMPQGAAHSLHLHPLSVISGTYYVEVPPGSSAIKFEDPRMSKFMAAPAKKASARPRNQSYISHQPKAGDVMLWESWLRHEVPVNRGKKPRASISFNYDWLP